MSLVCCNNTNFLSRDNFKTLKKLDRVAVPILIMHDPTTKKYNKKKSVILLLGIT